MRGGRPRLIATFRDERLVAVELVHWAGRDGCPMPVEPIDPDRYAPRRFAPVVSVVSGPRGTVEAYTNRS